MLVAAIGLLITVGLLAARRSSPSTTRSVVTVSRTFEATGGPVVVTVTVTGAGPDGCGVRLLDGAGAVLATGRAGAGPLVLRGRALPARSPFRVELHAPGGTPIDWQATIGGATL